MENPNIQNDPVAQETIHKVKSVAQNLLDLAGVEDRDGSMQTIAFGIEYSALAEHSEHALPSIRINKALGELAAQARWDYEITVGAQDASASRHALFMKDDSVQPEIAYYDGRPDGQMTELEAIAIMTDLKRAIGSFTTQ